MTYCPWEDLASRPHITFGVTRLPAGYGWWLPAHETILLDDRLDRVGRRVYLTHELVHVDHDDEQIAMCGEDGPRLARRQESRTDRITARRLIDLTRLAAAAATHPHDPGAAAAELDVTEDVLACRVEHLDEAERAWLSCELERRAS